MGYRTLRDCINDLERHRQLLRIDVEVDARLEAAEIHRRVCAAGGPALLFTRVRGCRFPMVSNLFGTIDRARFMFRDSLERVRRLVELKLDPTAALRHPLRYAGASRGALTMVPRFVRRAAVTANETTISQLPQQVSWPEDGGAFITLPQVYTEDVRAPGWRRSNLGMYRVQLSGGRYEPDREVGLHYQIHRSIGVHHAAAIEAGKPFRVNIFVGGPPAMMLAAVLPLPEGMSELAFAGALGGRRVRMFRPSLPLPSGEGGERSSPGEGLLHPPETTARHSAGCDACRHTGYRGRLVLADMLPPLTGELAQAILGRRDSAELSRVAAAAGMTTVSQRAAAAVAAGRTDLAEVRRVLGFAEDESGRGEW
jgi:4-hydroxy-3-polyprenylbenzoate decarboxylase